MAGERNIRGRGIVFSGCDSTGGRGNEEIRMPKSEGPRKSEWRNPKVRYARATFLQSRPFIIRISAFFRPSVFGFRPSLTPAPFPPLLCNCLAVGFRLRVRQLGKGFL